MVDYILSFGSNSTGQLGSADVTQRYHVRKLEPSEEMNGITCCWDSTLINIKAETGSHRFLWGAIPSLPDADAGAVLGSTANAIVYYRNDPEERDSHDVCEAKVKDVGGLLTIVNAASMPTSIPLARRLTQISSGGLSHILMVDDHGQVWAYGDNHYGQCGVVTMRRGRGEAEPQASMVRDPVMLNCFGEDTHNGTAAFVACGWNHSAVVSTKGQLFMFGLNTHGQCGLPNRSVDGKVPEVGTKRGRDAALDDLATAFIIEEPTRIPHFDDLYEVFAQMELMAGGGVRTVTGPVLHVACSAWHTVAVTCDGSVYSVGSGRYGQLGHSYPENGSNISLPPFLQSAVLGKCRGGEGQFRRIDCEDWTDAAVVVAAAPRLSCCITRAGRLLVWGVGWSPADDSFSCIPVEFPWHDIVHDVSAEQVRATSVCCSHSHLVVGFKVIADASTLACSSVDLGAP